MEPSRSLSPAAPEVTAAVTTYCCPNPNCSGAELEATADGRWLSCSDCGRAYHPEDMPGIARSVAAQTRIRAARQAERQLQADIDECRLEDERRGDPTGGSSSAKVRREDKLKVVSIKPAWDDSVETKTEPLEKKTRMVEVPIATSTAEVYAALQAQAKRDLEQAGHRDANTELNIIQESCGNT